MGKLKKLFTNWRVLLLVVTLVLAIASIRPNPYRDGVAIRSVIFNSSASIAGIQSPSPTATPMSKELITFINNKAVENIEDYNKALGKLPINATIQIKTNKGIYRLVTREKVDIVELNQTEVKEISEVQEINETVNGSIVVVNKTIKRKIEVPKVQVVHTGLTENIGLNVYNAPINNIKKGLDLQGGTRVLLQPEEELTKYEMDTLVDNMKERLNVYGLTDLAIRQVGDLSGNQYVLVEIAGANEDEVKDLLAKQGKFEARIGNSTVFKGGQDIKYVCRSADCAGIDPSYGCQASGSQWFCTFRFSISLSPESAQRQADATKDLEVVMEDKQQYLSEKLILFLDNKQVDELRIGAELKGKATTDIQISGSGVGNSQQEAAFDALRNMKRLQTILITGSLPVKLNIVKTDNISPILGEEFIQNALFVGLLAIIVVGLIIFVKYRRLKVTLLVMATNLAELVIIFGAATLIGWNIDLAAIAGIIISIGTGVDNLIVITDETLGGGAGRAETIFNWKERVKNAFFIITGSYLTVFVAMIPLVFAGAGLLKGFAITTLIGFSLGIFITRPAYAAMIEIFLKD